MKGKIIPLKQRGDIWCRKAGNIAGTEEMPAEPMSEVSQILWRASRRSPAVLRGQLTDIAEKGKRICPALFLLISSPCQEELRQAYRLAASLEALHLAMEIHRDITASRGLSRKEAILGGDFYFGLALTLAADLPVFIQGMSEVISRFAAAAINMPEQAMDDLDCMRHLQRICDGSASIFALSCTLGASYASLEPEQNEALSYYGLYLGMALQLKEETVNFETALEEKKPLSRPFLPLIYTLSKSPMGKKLALMANGSLSDGEYVVLRKEIERVDPWSYMEQIIAGCFSKAERFLELLRGGLDPEIMRSLKSYLQ